MGTLLQQALRCEVSIDQFWQMTPRETFAAIEAYYWRSELNLKQSVRIAWLTAALIRKQGRLPSVNILLMDKKAKKLTGRELAERRKEFKEMTANIDLSKIKKGTDG